MDFGIVGNKQLSVWCSLAELRKRFGTRRFQLHTLLREGTDQGPAQELLTPAFHFFFINDYVEMADAPAITLRERAPAKHNDGILKGAVGYLHWITADGFVHDLVPQENAQRIRSCIAVDDDAQHQLDGAEFGVSLGLVILELWIGRNWTRRGLSVSISENGIDDFLKSIVGHPWSHTGSSLPWASAVAETRSRTVEGKKASAAFELIKHGGLARQISAISKSPELTYR